MKNGVLTTLLAVTIMAGLGVQTEAATYRFNGTDDSAWNNSANWDLGIVPGANDQARLQAAKTADIDTAEVIGGLNLRGHTSLGTSIINVNSGGSLASDGAGFSGVNRVGSNGDATLNINNGGLVDFSGTGLFEIGESGGGDVGYVNVYTGGTLQVSQETQLGADGATTGNLLVDGGSATFSNILALGQAAGSTGTVTMTSGSLVLAGSRIEMTDNSSAVAYFNMTGGTLTHTDDDVQIGRDGMATFTQSGGEIIGKGLLIGHLKTATGVMIMSGGTNTLSGTITLGNQGDGTDNASGSLVMSGGWMTTGAIEVGASVGTTGTLVLSGSNTYLKASTLRLGDTGVVATSSIVVSDGEFQIHKILSDGDSATESIFVNGGVLKLRTIDGATGFDDAVALIDSGVLTWTNGVLGTGRSPATADLFWTNGVGSVLMADTNGTHYAYLWADAPQPTPTYADWASLWNLTTENEFTDNPDGDSFDNLAEYGLGGNPTNANDIGLFSVGSELDSGTNWFIYVYNRRTDAVDRGLAYEVLNKENLVIGTWESDYELAIGVSDPFVGSLGDEFESVTNRIFMDGQSQEFTQLKIGLD